MFGAGKVTQGNAKVLLSRVMRRLSEARYCLATAKFSKVKQRQSNARYGTATALYGEAEQGNGEEKE